MLILVNMREQLELEEDTVHENEIEDDTDLENL